jgi:hypothetical protein
VSRYWTPDVEQAKTVDSVGACGTGTTAIATFVSDVPPSAFVTPTDTSDTTNGAHRTITWWEVAGTRDQLIRRVCDGSATPDSRVVVSDLKSTPSLDPSAAPRYTISVTVPDRSRADKKYTFTVTALSQLSITTSTT